MKIREMLLIMLLCIFYVYNPLSYTFEWVSYYDEILAIIFLLYLLVIFVRNKTKIRASKAHIRYFYYIFALIAVGILGNALNVKRDIFLIGFDMLTCSKNSIAFAAAFCFAKKINIPKTFNILSKVSIILLLLCSFGYISKLTIFFESDGAYKFVFHNVGTLMMYLVLALSIFLCNISNHKRISAVDVISVSAAFFLIISTLTTSGFGVAFAFLIFLFIVYKKQRINVKFLLFFVLLIPVALVAMPDIMLYYGDIFSDSGLEIKEMPPRSMLLLGGVQIASMYFPIGTGFATYSSSAAIKSFSPVYSDIGLTILDSKHLSGAAYDCMLANVLGQFGVVGMAVMVLIFLQLFYISNKVSINGNLIAYYTILAILLIFTITSQSIFSGWLMPFFIILGIILASNSKPQQGAFK